MTDPFDQDMLLGYVEGTLSDKDRAAFEQKLAEDDALRHLMAALIEDKKQLTDLPAVTPHHDFIDELMQQQERSMLLGDQADAPLPIQPQQEQIKRRIHVSKFLAYASMAAVIAICASLITLTLVDTDLIELASRYTNEPESNTELALADATLSAELDLALKEESAALSKEIPATGTSSKQTRALADAPDSSLLQKKLAEAKAPSTRDDSMEKEVIRLGYASGINLDAKPATGQSTQAKTKSTTDLAGRIARADLGNNQDFYRAAEPSHSFKRSQMGNMMLADSDESLFAEGEQKTDTRIAAASSLQIEPEQSAIKKQTAPSAILKNSPILILPQQQSIALVVDTDSAFATEHQLIKWASTNNSNLFRTAAIEAKHTVPTRDNAINTRSTGQKANSKDTAQENSFAMRLRRYTTENNITPKNNTASSSTIAPAAVNTTPKAASTYNPNSRAADATGFTTPLIHEEASTTPPKSIGATTSKVATAQTQTPVSQNIVIELPLDDVKYLVRALKVRSGQSVRIIQQPLTTENTSLSENRPDSSPSNFAGEVNIQTDTTSHQQTQYWWYQDKAGASNLVGYDVNLGAVLHQQLPLTATRPVIHVKQNKPIRLPIMIIESTLTPTPSTTEKTTVSDPSSAQDKPTADKTKPDTSSSSQN
ncbi:hypothetical protein [Poriferisphaera sp. WC338]|uniref:hypothetical protein n=1 Tax=Poriferisphaera sp. WC338 TaxID=3425129 RepID=UPI003D817D05